MKKFNVKSFIIGCAVTFGALSTVSVLADTAAQSATIWLDYTKLTINGQPSTSQTLLYNDTLYISISNAARELGFTSNWNGNTNTTNIVTKNVAQAAPYIEKYQFYPENSEIIDIGAIFGRASKGTNFNSYGRFLYRYYAEDYSGKYSGASIVTLWCESMESIGWECLGIEKTEGGYEVTYFSKGIYSVAIHYNTKDKGFSIFGDTALVYAKPTIYKFYPDNNNVIDFGLMFGVRGSRTTFDLEGQYTTGYGFHYNYYREDIAYVGDMVVVARAYRDALIEVGYVFDDIAYDDEGGEEFTYIMKKGSDRVHIVCDNKSTYKHIAIIGEITNVANVPK